MNHINDNSLGFHQFVKGMFILNLNWTLHRYLGPSQLIPSEWANTATAQERRSFSASVLRSRFVLSSFLSSVFKSVRMHWGCACLFNMSGWIIQALFSACFQVYRWTGENSYFVKGNTDSLQMGGGGWVDWPSWDLFQSFKTCWWVESGCTMQKSVIAWYCEITSYLNLCSYFPILTPSTLLCSGQLGLWLDAELYRGTTTKCATFNNQPLSAQQDFNIHSLEVWTFE